MTLSANQRMGLVAATVFVLDQATKQAVLRWLPAGEKNVLDGFFKFVNWHNTGAAWSMFHDQNSLLAVISLLALLGLFLWRHHFDTKSLSGQISLGLIFGGILGNLCDRLLIGHVVDFLRFYLYQRNGLELGFPAFNVADSAICVGVGLLFILSWKNETAPAPAADAK
jgi:signal peptidase II